MKIKIGKVKGKVLGIGKFNIKDVEFECPDYEKLLDDPEKIEKYFEGQEKIFKLLPSILEEIY